MNDDYRNQIERTRQERVATQGEPKTTESAHAPGKFVRPSMLANALLVIMLVAAAVAWLVFR
jgi:hypothetical protein